MLSGSSSTRVGTRAKGVPRATPSQQPVPKFCANCVLLFTRKSHVHRASKIAVLCMQTDAFNSEPAEATGRLLELRVDEEASSWWPFSAAARQVFA